MTLQQHNQNMIKSFFSSPTQKAILVIQQAIDSGKCSIETGMSQIAAIKSL